MKKILIFMCLTICISLTQAKNRSVRFAVISDIHNDIMHDGEERLTAFLNAARQNKVDFIIELGDFCFPIEANHSFRNGWNAYPGEKYHVLGNHDMDVSSKEAYMAYHQMENRYYSFDKGDFHFIVLDPNNIFTDETYVPYKNGNYYIESSKIDYIDPEQIEWLKKDLAATNKHCILFSHQCLENTVQNREEVRKILEEENRKSGFTKVVAAFSGHDHTDYAKEINGITYIQINSASNQWVGDKYACPERFSDEINKKKPSLQYTVPYKDPLYAIVTLNKKGLKLKGKESTFIPPTPEELGIPSDQYPYPLVPRISSFTLSISKKQ